MCHPSWARARAEAQRLEDLARSRRAHDRIDPEDAVPADVEAFIPAGTARGAGAVVTVGGSGG